MTVLYILELGMHKTDCVRVAVNFYTISIIETFQYDEHAYGQWVISTPAAFTLVDGLWSANLSMH